MTAPDRIAVEVVYAPSPQEQVLLPVQLPAGSDVRTAIEASGVLARYPQLEPGRLKVGVFGQLVRLDRPLEAGDRVEIYRSLRADPKEVRRQRARLG